MFRAVAGTMWSLGYRHAAVAFRFHYILRSGEHPAARWCDVAINEERLQCGVITLVGRPHARSSSIRVVDYTGGGRTQ